VATLGVRDQLVAVAEFVTTHNPAVKALTSTVASLTMPAFLLDHGLSDGTCRSLHLEEFVSRKVGRTAGVSLTVQPGGTRQQPGVARSAVSGQKQEQVRRGYAVRLLTVSAAIFCAAPQGSCCHGPASGSSAVAALM
jgi:hypothetical protein